MRQLRLYGEGRSQTLRWAAHLALARSRELVVAWRVTDETEVPRTIEVDLIASFRAHYGSVLRNDTD